MTKPLAATAGVVRYGTHHGWAPIVSAAHSLFAAVTSLEVCLDTVLLVQLGQDEVLDQVKFSGLGSCEPPVDVVFELAV